MKIKNLNLKAIAFALVFCFVGCGNQNSTVEFENTQGIVKELDELEEDIKSLEDKLEQHIEETKESKILTDEEIRTIVEKIENNTVYWANYLSTEKQLSIKDYRYSETENYNAPDTIYPNINLLLSQPDVKTLLLEDTNFDLSKIDISNLERVQLVNIRLENAKEIMQAASQNGIKLEYTLHTDIEESSKIINFIAENGITCDSLSLVVANSDELTKFCSLLDKVNATKIVFSLRHNDLQEGIININTKLNDNTQSLDIQFDSLTKNMSFENRELGNFEVYSNNPLVSISLTEVLITENTKFTIPENTNCVFLYGSYTNTKPFYDLKDVSLLHYFDTEVYKAFNTNETANFEELMDEINSAHGAQYSKK